RVLNLDQFASETACLTGRLHRRKHCTDRSDRLENDAMQRLSRITLAGFLALALAACATTPPPDLTPPQKRLDAKTTLENKY
ncbi:hypothetical protein, partial [Bosea sp. (in: a-proteobacteria)]|uniref:hypothetical protein n=1 Tax=Bosea sp. (in: a-proteobacteria) TaxID=1871050 RepID=UPI003F6FC806